MDSESSSSFEKVRCLREKLSSVAWVQCDNTRCMKWRKVKKEVADSLSPDTWWECCMNEDVRFNSCTAPEEDVETFDKLAKKAKLVVFKSELTPGSLVWAKAMGYCKWPAIITEDPCNGQYWEEEEDEPEKGYYHVEYVGKLRCHGWVFNNCVELFGEGNISLQIAEKENDSKSKDQTSKYKKKKNKSTYVKTTKKLKRSYGGQTVHTAIEEAKRLLPLSLEQRLQTCEFFAAKGTKFKEKKKDDLEKKSSEKAKFPKRKESLGKNSFPKAKSKKRKNTTADKEQDALFSQGSDLCSFDFYTSLIDVTMEERFFLDIKTYNEKKYLFLSSLSSFYSYHDLELVKAPEWQGMKIDLFDLFLAVYDRGGFDKVNKTGLWSSVVFELTHFPSEKGDNAKSFYKRYFYSYELYIKGENYIGSMRDMNRCKKYKKTNIEKSPESESSIVSLNVEDDDLDSNEFEEALDKLDHLVQSLQDKVAVVPDVQDDYSVRECEREVVDAWNVCRKVSKSKSDLLCATTASELGIAAEPGEEAQIVPEMDFSSLTESESLHQGSHQEHQDQVENDENDPNNDNHDHNNGNNHSNNGNNDNDRKVPLLVEDHNGEEWIVQELQALEYHF